MVAGWRWVLVVMISTPTVDLNSQVVTALLKMESSMLCVVMRMEKLLLAITSELLNTSSRQLTPKRKQILTNVKILKLLKMGCAWTKDKASWDMTGRSKTRQKEQVLPKPTTWIHTLVIFWRSKPSFQQAQQCQRNGGTLMQLLFMVILRLPLLIMLVKRKL